MNYPVWELEMGPGLLIAIVAILHVYVSHFAIGGGLFLVLTEHYAYRKDDKHLRDYLIKHSKFFALVTLVFGSISGVGIWFTIGLVSPAATSSLIHLFVWGWATEWAMFIVEIAAAIVYYQTWDRVSRTTHLAVGWVYFIFAFLSLVVINGIVTFMLTPGEWLQTGSFWDAFFNPTYWPSLFARTAFCIGLAGIYALVTGSFHKHKATRERIVRYAAIWGLVGTLLAIPSLWWYHNLLPAGSAELLAGGMPPAAFAAKVIVWGGLALAVIFLAPLFFPKHFGPGSAITFAITALLVFGASEWVRESIRKPYIIHGYMYGNGMLVTDAGDLPNRGGILANALWAEHKTPEADVAVGKEVFRLACRSCHTLEGYDGLREPLRGLDEQYIYELIGRVEFVRGQMPPFPGVETERRALAMYLASEAGTEWAMVSGEEVFYKRCGFCHMKEGYRPLLASMEGNTEQDVIDMLPSLGEMADGMTPWTGSPDEARMLAEFIVSWYAAKPTAQTATDSTGGGN
jgi:mono/diheme cytochrome c family protein